MSDAIHPFSRAAALAASVEIFQTWWLRAECPEPRTIRQCRGARYTSLIHVHVPPDTRIAELVPRLICKHCRRRYDRVDLISHNDGLVSSHPPDVTIRLIGSGMWADAGAAMERVRERRPDLRVVGDGRLGT